MPEHNPKVFISYSHDSEEHMERVLALSDRLRTDGIDCIIDQYETSPPEGWTQWMIKQVKKADSVLIACTKTYQLRFEGEEESGKGKGAIWEGAIITQELYDSQGRNEKFIPVIFTPEDETHIPIILRGSTYYIPNTEKGYESLKRHLTKQPSIVKPELGKLKSMPPRSRKQEFRAQPCNVPFPRNPYFTGREQVLEQLHDALKSDKAAALAQAISGLGGIGKTQTAVEYTYQYRNEYDAVLWVKADSREALISDYAVLAHVLDLPEKNAKEQNLAVAAVRRWLENNSGWLLVFDNADEPGLLEEYIPINHKGHILLTSRAQQFDKLGISKPVELKKMPPDEAKEFLLKRTGRSDPSQAENEAILEIAEKLDYLPLALEQAGAYIKELKSGFSNYLSSYLTRGLEMFKKHPPVTGKYPKSVATTWLLNFDEVEKISKASAELLAASAFLNPDNIPLELIIKGAPELGETISSVIEGIEKDPLVLDELLLPLTRYSLITRDASTYSIHRLVQAVIRDRIGKDAERVWAERTVKAINRAFPYVEFSNWHLCERLIPHAQAGAEFIRKYEFEFEETARLLNRAGLYQYERALYSEAETMLRRALEIREKSLGTNHPDVATSLNNLALLYHSHGKFDEAEPMYRRALEIREKSQDKDHPDVAQSLNNLAELYRAHGKFIEAEPMHRRALAIREKSFGSDHPDVANSLNNLALLYDSQGKYAEAEPLYRRALEILEKSLGTDHPDVATSLNNLALLYKTQAKYEKAEPLYRRALEILEKSLGTDHPDVATSLNNLAELYRAQGKYAQAEPMFRHALEIREKSLGEDHPDVAQSLNNLAGLYSTQGKYDKAEPMFRRALEIYEKSLGKNHPNVATLIENLAALLRKTNREAEAKEMEERARRIRGGRKGN
ncbi:MAG: FxSxx-COOH system tetratricopeptide repeat protein [Candidatus Methanoperedens sp.]|nr:FxSxx-COOH system tetratricopeptide repeat protein [Candidatus Methanoperedens sp.]